ncbi:MAG: site-specific integrase [Magnetospirillum sp. WYHS-4]
MENLPQPGRSRGLGARRRKQDGPRRLRQHGGGREHDPGGCPGSLRTRSDPQEERRQAGEIPPRHLAPRQAGPAISRRHPLLRSGRVAGPAAGGRLFRLQGAKRSGPAGAPVQRRRRRVGHGGAPQPRPQQRLKKGEQDRLLEACRASRSTWLAPIVVLAMETGMRLGEIVGLQWENVDFGSRVAALPMTKNGTRREVPLSSRAIVTLRKLPRSIDGRVFPITDEAVKRAWRAATTRADIEDLRFHDLRHEATSRLFEKGLDTMEVAAVTGHKTLTMLRRYTHLKAADLAKKLG